MGFDVGSTSEATSKFLALNGNFSSEHEITNRPTRISEAVTVLGGKSVELSFQTDAPRFNVAQDPRKLHRLTALVLFLPLFRDKSMALKKRESVQHFVFYAVVWAIGTGMLLVLSGWISLTQKHFSLHAEFMSGLGTNRGAHVDFDK